MTDLHKLRELASKATPGPWFWRQSSTGRIDLAAPHGGGTVVMDFARLGMQGAQPRFGVSSDHQPRGKRSGLLMTADEIIRSDPDRMLRHPDAELIAAASPEVVLALVDVAEKAQAMHQAFADANDCIDNAGAPFQSQWAADIAAALRTSLAALGEQGK